MLVWFTSCGGVSSVGGVASVPTSTCASGNQWVGGDRESAQMHPGVACTACHVSKGEGPRFAIAGTVFQNLDDKDDCGGVASNVSVVITDANAAVHTLSVNAMGNFMLERTTLALPYSAKVIDGSGGVREMVAKQTDGDCNVCHTATGAQAAPGRIIAP